PADTISRLVDAAVKAVEKIGVDTIADKANEAIEKAIAKDDAPAPSDEATPVPAPAASTPALSLNWCWGGFNGSKAKEVSDAQIDSLKITSSGMSYKWVKGGCEALGATSKTDSDHTLACLFLVDGRGGKFDWISTSRTTRDFKNINNGYNGWNASAFKACKTFYFCICSADGKRRTNVISCGSAAAASPEPATSSPKRSPLKCVHATCWNGKNASQRYMNMLSPKMSNDKFDSYLSAMKSRGCDTVHLLLMNKADGENAGYSIYGTGGTGTVHKDTVNHMTARLKKFRKAGLHIVLWGVSDDSADWANAMLSNAAKYSSDLKTTGILDYADLFVLGLEMNEYGSAAGWKALAKALRNVEPDLYLATHHTSGKYTYASLGSGVMGQLAENCAAKQIASMVSTIKKKGKDAWGFELARNPDRARAQAALDAGAVGVGNW
ncbi:MAG: hypothetical protein II841_01125, partial [Bacteroidales bacterium]|nr:hypothetical protein [Bacteroidales bacterium]